MQPLSALLDVLRERRGFVSRLDEFEVAAAGGKHRRLDAARRHVALLHERQAERVAVESVCLRPCRGRRCRRGGRLESSEAQISTDAHRLDCLSAVRYSVRATMDESQFSEPTRRWLESGRHLDIEGKRIFVYERGDGPAVLLLHGFPTSRIRLARRDRQPRRRVSLRSSRLPRLRPLRQARSLQLLALPADGRGRRAGEGARYRRGACRQPRRRHERAHGAARPRARGAARLPHPLVDVPERQHAPGDGDDHAVPEAPRLQRDAAAGDGDLRQHER